MVCPLCVAPLVVSSGVIGGSAAVNYNKISLWLSIVLSIIVIIYSSYRLSK